MADSDIDAEASVAGYSSLQATTSAASELLAGVCTGMLGEGGDSTTCVSAAVGYSASVETGVLLEAASTLDGTEGTEATCSSAALSIMAHTAADASHNHGICCFDKCYL